MQGHNGIIQVWADLCMDLAHIRCIRGILRWKPVWALPSLSVLVSSLQSRLSPETLIKRSRRRWLYCLFFYWDRKTLWNQMALPYKEWPRPFWEIQLHLFPSSIKSVLPSFKGDKSSLYISILLPVKRCTRLWENWVQPPNCFPEETNCK